MCLIPGNSPDCKSGNGSVFRCESSFTSKFEKFISFEITCLTSWSESASVIVSLFCDIFVSFWLIMEL